MNNYEKIMAELQNMSIEEFAKERIGYNDDWGYFWGDFGRTDDYASALKYEIEWLNKEVEV